MSDVFWTNLPSILVGIGTLATTLVSLFISLGNRRIALGNQRLSRETSEKIEAQGDNISAIHTATNGMKDQLVKVTAESEYAKGKLDGQNEGRQHIKDSLIFREALEKPHEEKEK